MNSPTLFVVVPQGNHQTDPENWECGSNFDWCRSQAIKHAESRHGEVIVYKLVPVFKASLRVTTEVVQEDISAVQP